MINFNADQRTHASQSSSLDSPGKSDSNPNMNAYLLKSLESNFISSIHQNQQQMDEANQELKKAAQGQG